MMHALSKVQALGVERFASGLEVEGSSSLVKGVIKIVVGMRMYKTKVRKPKEVNESNGRILMLETPLTPAKC